MPNAQRIIPIEVLGRTYPVSTELAPEYVAKLATIVDERMRHVMRQTPNGETLQLAVLAALNIADELLRCREANAERTDQLASRTGELERLLDRVLMA